MRLREVKRSVRSLSLRQLVKLDAWLHGLIEAAAGPTAGQKVYRLELVRCGKENCRCSRGELHGPYWYAYWTEGGKTRSQYVGKELPESARRSRPSSV